MTFAPSTKPRRLSWHIIFFMAFIHSMALLALLPSNFRWSAVAIALMFHTITAGFGVTLGFHRLVAHRSFQVPKWLEYLLVFCGSLSCQGGPIEWIG
ncbi:MAG: acyl-CoA desaturase, partial [Leptolyngbyaceae bacterium]|nr:acyl-CoA desaturase [Leptolyngbyaceae bacterium]